MSVFEEACYLSNQRWVKSLTVPAEEIVFSKQHQRYMRILFDKMRGNRYHHLTRRMTAALIAAVLLISMTVSVFAIPSAREFVIHRFFDHSQYAVVGGERYEVKTIEIGYIPEGFEKSDEFSQVWNKQIIYCDTSNQYWFELRKMPLHIKTTMDTETYQHEEITYNGVNYTYYYDNNIKGYVYNNGNYVYEICGNLDKEELFKILISVK